MMYYCIVKPNCSIFSWPVQSTGNYFCHPKGVVQAGLAKLTNANRSISTVNDQLFPVELTELADWTSMSEYILQS